MEEYHNPCNSRNLVAILSIFIAIGVGIALGSFWQKYQHESMHLAKQLATMNYNFDILKNTVSQLKEEIREVSIQNIMEKKGLVDFTNSQIQDIGSGFYVVGMGMKQHLTGIIFSGRIINTQSVRHRNATFKIKIKEKEKDFTINMISAGNSTSFTVYVPDIKPEDTHYGGINFQQSSVEYYTK